MVAGTVVSGLVVGAASVMTDVPGAGAPEATTLEVPAGSEFDQARDDTKAELPATQETPDPSEMAKVAAPEPDDLSLIETDATQSAAQPETGETEVALNAPAAADTAVGVAVETDSPVLPSPQANAPQVPVAEEELSISTVPAQPVQPEVAQEEETAFAVPEGSAALEASEPEQATPDTSDVATPEPTVEEPETETAPDIQDDVASMTLPAETVGSDSGADNVTTGRLPSVTAEPEPEIVEEDVTEPDEEIVLTDDADLPPIQRFAADFENPDNKPMMSIVLIDDGSSPIGLDEVKSFPYPLSFAVDTGWPGASEAMRKYRDAGFEVLAMVDMPAGAAASDTEVSMQSYLQRVPEAVAVMEGVQTGLQTSREAAEQLAQILRDTGHGAVMFGKGLNTAQKLIAREGVPSASVFRDFDSKGQSATVIRRFLDQAAFRAGQEDQGVIMVGRLRDETISALLLWGLQDRAGRVAIAPVTAVLSAQ